jgi:hypothetical protein
VELGVNFFKLASSVYFILNAALALLFLDFSLARLRLLSLEFFKAV